MSFSTRSYTSRSLESRDNTLAVYTTQLETYAKKYIVSFDGSESSKEWSSRHAERFLKTVNNCVPLAVVTRDLENYVSKVTPTRLSVTRYHLLQNQKQPTAEEYESAQWSNGRYQFNKFLFSEFDTWYSAFEAEADEDQDGASAASRWVYHCAKKLSRTGLAAESLAPVIEAWLNQHLSANE